MRIRSLALLITVTSASSISIANAAVNPTVWFGAKEGFNGIAVVPRNASRQNVTVAPGANPVVAAHLYRDSAEYLDVTDCAAWTGTVFVVPHGPCRGLILAHQTSTNWLGVSYLGFADSISVMVRTPNDADNDGMLDQWELSHGLNTNNAADASADANGNGVPNRDEFLNGTDPCTWREVFAFTPLHRYPYSNGFYCAPDVNLEWFASSTLGHYQVEVALWPACDRILYRADVWDTNAIGDAVVHTAYLGSGVNTQCAFRVRAAFTNEAGWTAWSTWRPFTVLEPLTDHTLRMPNGQPLRGIYFFFWNQPTNALVPVWSAPPRSYSYNTITNALECLRLYGYIDALDWHTNDALCLRDLSKVRDALGLNTVFLDQHILDICQGGTHFSSNEYIFNTSSWSTQYDRNNSLCLSGAVFHLPWLSHPYWGGFNPPEYATDGHYNPYNLNSIYMSWRYLGRELDDSVHTNALRRFGANSYSTNDAFRCLPDISHADYRKMWVGFIRDYITRYSSNTNGALNSLVLVMNRQKVIPMLAPMVELSPYDILDFGGKAVADFRDWVALRYGDVRFLHAAWQTGLVTWSRIDPVNQDGTIFLWDATNNYERTRAADDFTEYSIERFVAGWLDIRSQVQESTPVCFAVENISPLGFTKSNGHVPLYRVNDFADVVVQRHGFDYCTVSDRIKTGDLHKAGKHVVFAGMGAGEWLPTYAFYMLAALLHGGNPGTYTWNECFDISGLIFNIPCTNWVSYYAQCAGGVAVNLIPNGDFESGTAAFVPSWSITPGSAAQRTSCAAYQGAAALELDGHGHAVTIDSATFVCDSMRRHVLLFTLRVEGEIADRVLVEGSIRIGDTTLNLQFNSQGWDASPDPLTDPHNPEVGMHIMGLGGPLNSTQRQANQWVSFVRGFAPGILTGTQQLSFTFAVDKQVRLYIDAVTLLVLPEDAQ